MRSIDTDGGSPLPLRLPLLALLVLLSILALAAGLSAADGPGDEDAGDDLDSAMEIGVGTWNGTIFRNGTAEDTADFYSFRYDAGSVVTASVVLDGTSTTHLDIHFNVYDRERNEVMFFNFPSLGAPSLFATLTNDEVTDPVYFLAVTWDGSSVLEYRISYILNVDHSLGTQDDAGTGGDVPRTHAEAHDLGLGVWNGSVGGSDFDWDEDVNADGGDMFVISPEMGNFLRVQVTLTLASTIRGRSLVLALENSTGAVMDLLSISEEGDISSIRYYPKTEEEELYLNMTSTAVINNYTLVITSEVPGADGDGRADAGEDPDHAMDLDREVMQGVIMRGHGAEDLADYFDLEFPSSNFVEVSLTLRTGTVSTSKVVFRVLDHTKTEVVNFTFSGLDEPRRFATLTNSRYTILRYYLGITWEGGEEGDFEFRYEISHQLGPVQDDMGKGKDVTNTTSGPPTVSMDTPVTGTVGGSSPSWSDDLNADGADVYEVVPVAGRFVVVKARLDAFNGQRRLGFDVRLDDQSGKLLVKPQSVFDVGDELEIRFFADRELPVYVVITSESESCNYNLVVSMEEPPDIDIYVGDLSVSPSNPEPGADATITVVISSTALITPATQIRVEVFAGGNKLDHRDVIFDNSDQEETTFPWTVPSSDTEVTVTVDTLVAIPWDSDKDNNEMTIDVTVGEDGTSGGDDDDDDGMAMLVWILALVGVIALVTLVTVVYVVFRRHGAEDEEPEDY